jgi:hypothetical protein
MKPWFSSWLLGLCAVSLLSASQALAKRPNDQTIQCSSDKGRYQYCRTFAVGEVRLIRQLSTAPCRRYKSWGADGDGSGIWVSNGCRGVFEVRQRGGPWFPPTHDRPRSITCKSPDFSYNRCATSTWGRRITVARQLSRTRCVRGNNWGIDYSGIWVNAGCSAVFAID